MAAERPCEEDRHVSVERDLLRVEALLLLQKVQMCDLHYSGRCANVATKRFSHPQGDRGCVCEQHATALGPICTITDMPAAEAMRRLQNFVATGEYA